MKLTDNVPILMVDDQVENLRALEAVLDSPGLTLVRAQSGAEALQLVLHHDFALVLLDVQMPVMDGFEVAESLRLNPRTRHIPIIFVTAGMNDLNLQFKGYQLGAVDYLIKPVALVVLLSKVRVFCDLYRQRKEIEGFGQRMEALVEARTASLLESQALLHEVGRMAKVGGWEIDIASREMVWSEQVCQIHGVDAEYVPTLASSGDFYVPESREALRQAMEKSIENGTPFELELQLNTPAGHPRWVHAMGRLHVKKNQSRVVAGTFQDITERKQAEEALRQGKLLNEYLLQTIPFPMNIVNAQGRVLFMNTEMNKVIGHGNVAEYCWQMYRDDKTQCSNCPLHQPIRIGETSVMESTGVLYERTYDVYHTGLIYQGQEALLEIFVDITERRKLEAEQQQLLAHLEQAKSAAESANQAKSRFLATMSHDLRTPLNAILGMAQILLEPDSSESERMEYAKTIFDSGNTLLAILNDILDLSKIEAGKMTLQRRPFTVHQLLMEAQNLFQPLAQDKGLQIRVECSLDPDQPYWGDPVRLRQMINNYVSNAIKFTDQGYVRLLAMTEESTETMDILRFSVIDTGRGITPAQRAMLFLPFAQLENTGQRTLAGTGLGLSIVDNLAKLMGGEVGCESAPGQGANFWFTLPAERVDVSTNSHNLRGLDSSVTAARSLPGVEARQTLQLILLVDDNLANRRLTELMLGKLGYPCHSVEDGSLALKAITDGGNYALILMDCQMPVMDGLEATRRIRQWEQSQGKSRTTIIALSADVFDENRERCHAAGMDEFMAKPIYFGALRESLDRWLRPALLENPNAGPAVGSPEGANGVNGVWSDLKVLDVDKALSSIGGDASLLNTLVCLLIDQIGVDMPEIRSSVAAGDTGRLKDMVHRLKGSLASVGATGAFDACNALNLLARENKVAEYANGLVRLEGEIERLEDVLKRFIPP